MRVYSVEVTRVSTGAVVQVQVEAKNAVTAEKSARSEFPRLRRYTTEAHRVRWSQHLPVAAKPARVPFYETFERRPGLVTVGV